MHLNFSLDIFSKKRLYFSVVTHFIYIFVFLFSFLLSIFLYHLIDDTFKFNFNILITSFVFFAAVKFFILNFFNFKRFAIYANYKYDFFKNTIIFGISCICILFLKLFFPVLYSIPNHIIIFDNILCLGGIVAVNSLYRNMRNGIFFNLKKYFHQNNNNGYKRVLIVGAGNTGQSLYNILNKQHNNMYHILGFVDDNPDRIGKKILGLEIFGPIENIVAIANKLLVHHLIIAMPSVPAKRIREIIKLLSDTPFIVSTVPSYIDIIEGKVKINNIREYKIEELLSRDKIDIDINMLSNNIKGKSILVTGAAGSIGSELCKQILRFSPSSLILLDQAETPLFYLNRELQDLFPTQNIIPVIADVTNSNRIQLVFQEYRPSIVFHAAAYKHVPLMEENFEESFTNNVYGTKNVADTARHFKCDLFVLISTDKAVNPSSIMGLTKRIAEIYIQGLDQISTTKFITVRFGNVLDSKGNVIEIFKQQISHGGPVTVTHHDMTRYFMLASEASQLVLQACLIGNGGEIFVLDMGEPVKILDLAKTMIKISGFTPGKDINIVFTGLRPGEKYFEELKYNDEEYSRTPHSKIFVWQSQKNEWNYISKHINEIINCIYLFKFQDIYKNNIKYLVPEYKRLYLEYQQNSSDTFKLDEDYSVNKFNYEIKNI